MNVAVDAWLGMRSTRGCVFAHEDARVCHLPVCVILCLFAHVITYLCACAMIGEQGVAAGRQHPTRAGHGRWGQVADGGARVLESE